MFLILAVSAGLFYVLTTRLFPGEITNPLAAVAVVLVLLVFLSFVTFQAARWHSAN